MNKLAKEGIEDIGMKLSVKELAKKLKKRLNNGEEERQKIWKETRWEGIPRERTNTSKPQPDLVDTPGGTQQHQTNETGIQQQQTRETGAHKLEECRIRKPPFQANQWEMPKHIEDILEKDRETSSAYQAWKDRVRSRGDIKDQTPRFEFILPHFRKGYRKEVQEKIEKSQLKGMDYVDRETKAWHEALKECRTLNPWTTSGRDFKPSIDQDYHDLMRSASGSKAFAALKERTPKLTAPRQEKPQHSP